MKERFEDNGRIRVKDGNPRRLVPFNFARQNSSLGNQTLEIDLNL
jgi:hypothetical protein